jgi:cystathionine gamma-synthase
MIKPQTQIAQALGLIDEPTQAVILPTHHSTTYIRDADNTYPGGNVYSRADNPTYKPVEALLCELEQGGGALLFASGMAAAVSVFQALKPGDHVLIPEIMYWSLRHWLLDSATRWGLDVETVDMTDLELVSKQIQPGRTALVWLETPGNPLWTQTDITKVAAITHQAGAILAVDSTIATPVLTQPLALGADIVMHSATKYLNGHSDVISGALITKQDNEFWQTIKKIRAQGGAVPGPHDASLLLRGMRTLYIRVQQSCINAMYLAQALENHPRIVQVLYPGLISFEGHEIASKQMKGGFGGMMSIRIRGGKKAAIAVAKHVQIFKRATSLGGVESLIEHRASVEGEGTPVPDDLLRLSVGIEAKEDLLMDLLSALDELD